MVNDALALKAKTSYTATPHCKWMEKYAHILFVQERAGCVNSPCDSSVCLFVSVGEYV